MSDQESESRNLVDALPYIDVNDGFDEDPDVKNMVFALIQGEFIFAVVLLTSLNFSVPILSQMKQKGTRRRKTT